MRNLILAVCAVVAVLIPQRAAAQDPAHADSPRVTITVNNPTVVGDVTLQPGAYRFQCRHLEGKTFLVVTIVETGKEILRVPCQPETLSAKVAASEMRAIVRPDGTRALQSVRIKGETVGHRIAD